MLALILIITIGALLIATGLIIYGIYLLLQKEQNNKPKGNPIWMIIGGICLAIIFTPNALAFLNDSNLGLGGLFKSKSQILFETRDYEEAKALIDSGADVNYQTDEYGHSTVLLEAVKESDKQITLLLIQNGADVNTGDFGDMTPLHFAVLNDDAQIAKLLIDNGANLDATDFEGNTPLHYAQGENSELFKILKESGANPNITNDDNQTPLEKHQNDQNTYHH